jgi:hypothetical protein
LLLLKVNVEILAVMALMVYVSGILILLIYLCAVYEFKIFPEVEKNFKKQDSTPRDDLLLNICGIIISL